MFVFNIFMLLTCESTFLSSVLHLAVSHGREQLHVVDQVLQLMEQVNSTELINSQNYDGLVSDLQSLVSKWEIITKSKKS